MRLYLTLAVLALALCAVAEAQYRGNPYEDKYDNKYDDVEQYKNKNSEELSAETRRESRFFDKSRDKGIGIKDGIDLRNLDNNIERTRSQESKASSKKKEKTDYRRTYVNRYKPSNKKNAYEPKKYEQAEEKEEDRYERYERTRQPKKSYEPKNEYKPRYQKSYQPPSYEQEDQYQYRPTYKPTNDRYDERRYDADEYPSQPKKPKSSKPHYYQSKKVSYPKLKNEDSSYKLSASAPAAYAEAPAYKAAADEGVLIDNNNNNINKNAEEASSSNKATSANANEQGVEKKNQKLNYKENKGGYKRRN